MFMHMRQSRVAMPMAMPFYYGLITLVVLMSVMRIVAVFMLMRCRLV